MQNYLENLMRAYGFIYLTTNTVNGKKYIGQCSLVKNKNWQTYLGSGKHFLMAVKKYGKESFEREILCYAFSKSYLDELEQHFISEHDAVNDRTFYNIAAGGSSTGGFKGKTHSPEYKEHMRTVMLSDKHPTRGKSLSSETRTKMSISRKGKSNHTQEQLEKLRLLGKANAGKKLSDEHKSKVSQSLKGKTCKQWIIKTPAGEMIPIANLGEFCATHNLNVNTLQNTLNTGKPVTKGLASGWQLIRVD